MIHVRRAPYPPAAYAQAALIRAFRTGWTVAQAQRFAFLAWLYAGDPTMFAGGGHGS